MLRKSVLLVVFASLSLMVLTAFSQPPDGKGKGKKGPPPGEKKGPPPGWQPGKVIPPHVIDELDLSPSQMKQLHELEKEVRGRILKILTQEQKDRLHDIKGPPKGDKGPKDDGPKGKGPKGKDKGPKGKPKDDCGNCEAATLVFGRGIELAAHNATMIVGARRERI